MVEEDFEIDLNDLILLNWITSGKIYIFSELDFQKGDQMSEKGT